MLKKTVAYVLSFEKDLWILALGWFVGAIGFAVSIPFIAIYFHSELGLSMSEIGLFFGAMAIVRSIFQAVGGEMSDRVARCQLLIYSQVIRAVAFLFLAFAIFYNWGFWAIGIILMINSIFGAVFQPAANAMVSDILTTEKRLDGYAITRSAGNLGWAVGPAIGGFMAGYSYGLLFVISAVITFLSGMVFLIFMKTSNENAVTERFQMKDLLAIKDDKYMAVHAALIFVLYLVVAQLIAPFSVYAVDMVHLSENQLGILYTLNGLMVAFLQIPLTRLLAKRAYTTQLAWGGIVYAVGYGLIGILVGFNYFVLAIMIITFGEMLMSPPSLALTSRLAPKERIGRYMGIFGFFVASGWSFGPLYGGFILDHFADNPMMAWIMISSLGLISALGYWSYSKYLPRHLNYPEKTI